MRLTLLLLLALLAGCRTGRSYLDPAGPRYAGAPSRRAHDMLRSDTLVLVSFNIAFAREIDSAIAVLASDSVLRRADVLMLQEMDEVGTRRIAHAFDLWYAYYPAIHHNRTRRDFGNAVLSRWPIVNDAKIVLPHPSRYAATHRIAAAATIRIGADSLRVYSTHLGTPADVGSRARLDQLRAIIADAAPYGRVVIGGDMNESDVGAVAREAGYAWPTERGPRTTFFGRWDHIYLRGLRTADSGGTGTVDDVRGSSDHRPVWVIGLLRPSATSR
jgi:endonuclease/exonuclease/phosphatase family metal-dependent hydrolase